MPFAEFYLVRHGESTWNRERRLQGHGDPPLTAEGCVQIATLARRVDRGLIEVLVSSDLQRALLTAKAIAAKTGVTIDVRPEWREHDMGAWTGLTREQVKDRWPQEYATYRAGSLTQEPGGGESRQAFRLRIKDALRALKERYDGRRLMLVTHRGPIRILMPEVRPAHAEILRLEDHGLH